MSIDQDYEYHELYLDSSDATNPITANVDPLNWPLFNLVVPLQNIASVKVLSAEIPFSYCVTKGGSFQITYYGVNNLTTLVQTVTLPVVGSPSGTQIASFISGQLSTFDLSSLGSPNGWGANRLVCTFIPASSSATGLPYFQFIPNANSTGNVGDINQNYQILISDQLTEDVMGLRVGTTFCNAFGGIGITAQSLLSTKPTLITGPAYLYVSSNAIGNNCKTYLPQGAALLSGGQSSPQMARIPISGTFGSWILFEDTNNNAWYDIDNIQSLSQIDVYCQLGNYGGYMDFQGLNFSIKLGILIHREKLNRTLQRGQITMAGFK